MDDLLADFIAETRDMLRGCEEAIVAWEAHPGDRQRLDAIFRFVHTVKGNCGFFDLPRLTALSHAAEGALGEVRAGRREADRALVSAVLAIIDRIMELVDALDTGQEIAVAGDEALIAALEGQACELPVAVAADLPSAQAPAVPVTRSIRLPVELLDRVMSGVSDMVLARNDLARRMRESRSVAELEGPFERLSGILSDVRESITRMRMNRIDQLYQSIPRLVRDLANELGKQVAVDFQGGDVELDREIMELIRDPVTHILRNAIDHGIESPAGRLRAGKRPAGSLAIAARHSGNEVHLTIADDGRGIDTTRLTAKAVEAGLIGAAEAETLSPERRMNLIFEPGLSTADTVSEVSGRGVGMDVVRANLERIGGTIQVTSVPGERTVFQLKVPLTLSIVPGIIVSAAGQQFAIPQSYVVEIVRRRSATLEATRMGATRLVSIRGRRIPYLRLDQVLGLAPAADQAAGQEDELADIVIVLQVSHEERCALGVAQISDYEDLVIKPLAPAIMQTGYYSGSTLLDDGRPILLLDIREIAVKHDLLSLDHGTAPVPEPAVETATAPQDTVLLFTGCDGVERAIRFPLIERIVLIAPDRIDRAGDRILASVDDALLPLAGLGDAAPEWGELRALCLHDGRNRLLYAVASIGDCVPLDTARTRIESDGAHESVFLTQDGKPVRLLDAHRLFAGEVAARPGEDSLICALPEDEWAARILAPVLAAAGYRIVQPGLDRPDVVIALDGKVPDSPSGEVVHLRSGQQDPASPACSIHRYDREGILAELRRIAGGGKA